MKEIQEEAKAALEKVQEDMKKYMDRKRGEADNYRVGDLVMLSTKDLKYQIVERRTEKLTVKGCKRELHTGTNKTCCASSQLHAKGPRRDNQR